LNADLRKISEIELIVERLNHDAPLQFRLLCKAVFKLPANVNIFQGGEYELLNVEPQLLAAHG